MSTPISEILAQIIRNIDQAETVKFTPGQIISLLVKQVENNQAMLTYQGKFLLARLETPINPGQRIRCMVEGERDGRVLLKVLPDSGQLPEDTGIRAVTGLLQELGLPVNERNRQIVRELVRQELPATRENLQAVSRMAQQNGVADTDLDVLTYIFKNELPVNPKSFGLINAALKEQGFISAPLENLRQQVAALAREQSADPELRAVGEKVMALIDKMSLKPGENSLQALNRLTDAPRLLGLSMGQNGLTALANIADKLTPVMRRQLPEVLLATAKALPPQPEMAPEPVKGAILLKDAVPAKDAMPLQDAMASKDAAASKDTMPLKNVTTSIDAIFSKEEQSTKDGIITKDALSSKDVILTKDALSSKDVILTKDALASKDAILTKDALASKDAVLTKDALSSKDVMPSKDNLTVKDAKNSGFPADSDGKDIAAVARALVRLADKNITGPGEEDLPTLLNKLQGLIKGETPSEKALQTIINTVQERLGTLETLQRPAGPGQEGFFLLQSMFQSGEKNHPLEMLVKFRKEEKDQNIDFSRCHVFVTLTTESLGMVQAAVQVSGRNLNCRFTAENEKARQSIEKRLPDLTAKLAQLEYNVTMLPSRIRVNDLPPALAPAAARTGLYQVDITV